MAKKFDEVRIPFTKMTFSPDVPSTALGPNEYNAGFNVETDVRGIRSMAGDQAILDNYPGAYAPTYVTGGYRQDGNFWFVIATTDGSWYCNDGMEMGPENGWYDITPPTITPTPGFYGQEQNITEAWNGTVVFFNDSKTAPMFWPQGTDANPVPNIIQYSQQIPLDITDIYPLSLTVQRVEFSSSFDITGTPFVTGETIEISNVQPRYFNGIYEVADDAVVSGSSGYVDILCTVTDAYSSSGQIAPQYSWNYNNQWKEVHATFMRLYNSPNVGSILVAGGLEATNLLDETEVFPVTVQWSQAFGLNQAPTTWTPTVTNVANQLEVPLRGQVIDAFPSNGQFFLCSYWDTVVFSPINYATTSTPILGVRIFNQGRGLLTSNAWANTDKLVYGVDARDIWVFDGNDFQGIGNQRVKNYFYNNLNPDYVDRLFMEVNTQKNQVEIYFADLNVATAGPLEGIPNAMLSYRYDLDCWNAPREVASATFACESPIWIDNEDSSVPAYVNNEGSRTVVYARGAVASHLIQKDQGYAWYDDMPIESEFRRDNIKLLPEYSGKLLVHRILPEVVNLGAFPDSGYDELPLPTDDPNYDQYRGNITVTVLGSNSVASNPSAITPVTKTIDANGNTNDLNPWAQINQNAFRVNSIKLSNASNSSIWMCSATTWQYTQTEDDR
jgi:hypothetical protein